MDRSLKKIAGFSACIIGGIILGGIITFHLFNKIYCHFVVKDQEVFIRHEIISPYTVLLPLRKGNTATAVERLEMQLDSGLYGMAVNNRMLDSEDHLLLKKIREYRAKYPRKNKNPEIETKINELLSLSSPKHR
ncbi:MAG: hypothetical protein WCS27_15140 [Victivallaceae bacterium]